MENNEFIKEIQPDLGVLFGLSIRKNNHRPCSVCGHTFPQGDYVDTCYICQIWGGSE